MTSDRPRQTRLRLCSNKHLELPTTASLAECGRKTTARITVLPTKTVLIIPISDEGQYFSGIMEEIKQNVLPGAMACIGSTLRSLPGQELR